MKAFNYLEFENKFRGDTESILSQFSKYDTLINLIIKDVENPKFVDIGSGRGEWLQKWGDKVNDCVGIENESFMISISKKKDLNIIDGDAIDILSTLPSNSVSILTMFHMIEHIDYKQSNKILSECFRVLSETGVFIIETPSIDNLIVSTNTFYLDHTHISHINPEALKFSMQNIGFDEVHDFYINGGPMMDDKHSKITRILNGVAQDLLIVATKNKNTSNLIFNDDKNWQKELNQSTKTMDACVEFDLRNEQIISELKEFDSYSKIEIEQLKQRINDQKISFDELNNQFYLLRNNLRYFLKVYFILKKILYPLYSLLKIFKRYSSLIFSKIINIIFKNKFFKKLFFSKIIQNIICSFFEKLPFIFSKKYLKRNQANLEKYKILDKSSVDFNKSLLAHYQRSKRSKNIAKSLIKYMKDK